MSQLNEQGLRVLGVSYKSDLEEDYDYEVKDESDMILTGYLAFLDHLSHLRLQLLKPWLSTVLPLRF